MYRIGDYPINGNRFKRMREALGFGYSEFAHLLKVSENYISKIENGRAGKGSQFTKSLKRYCPYWLAYLYGIDDNPPFPNYSSSDHLYNRYMQLAREILNCSYPAISDTLKTLIIQLYDQLRNKERLSAMEEEKQKTLRK